MKQADSVPTFGQTIDFSHFHEKPSSKSNCVCSSKWNNYIKASIRAWPQSHFVPCWCLIDDGLCVFKAFTVRAKIHLPIIPYYEDGGRRITRMVVAVGWGSFFSGWEERRLTEIERRHSGHVREMINSELHYWKASLIRCSHLPGVPAQDCRLGSHCGCCCCFFSLLEFSS